jgi:predicted molibdopterin-dependent oxidoreductase YjgC
MIDMGCYPSLGPGYSVLDEPGKDTRQILEAAASSELDALLVFGADPIADFPDAALAERALSGDAYVVVMELFATATATHADAVFPSVAYAEREGTLTNLERRLQKLEPVLAPPGAATEPWRACLRLAQALGEDWGWRNFGDVWADLRASVATHTDVDPSALAQARPAPQPALESPYQDDPSHATGAAAGPGGHYPRGYRSGSPFQTGQNWPLSWELRAFEARQRPGTIPYAPAGDGDGDARTRPPSAPRASEAADDFVLYTGRLIYDEGAMVSRTYALRGLARRPFVEINQEDAKDLGLSEGEEATLSVEGFDVRLEVVVADIARGSVFVPYAQDGLAANRLITEMNPRVKVAKA